MTGLDPDKNCIIEIATVVTDKELSVIAEGPTLAIHQSDEVLSGMDEWNTRQHANSGLTERVRASAVTEADAERLTLEFLRQHVDQGASPICGNSICQDRRFLISSRFEKKSVHLALADIHDSIRELRFYREHLFKR
jgi:oligoribonuclease